MKNRVFKNRNALLAFGLVAFVAVAAPSAVYADAVNTTSGVAIKGYDPVAYFVDGRPVQGKPEFQTEWMGAKWHFANAGNRDLFARSPEKYAPQYGGFCAYAAAKGSRAAVDPTVWKIVDGKLYLNFNSSVQRQWEQKAAEYIKQADQNWVRLKNE